MTNPKMKLAEIAKRIDGHLKRFEADPTINAAYKSDRRKGLHPYYCVCACASGTRVYIQYVGYQGSVGLKKADAIRYLEWLDAGNVGQHNKALREPKP